MEPIEIIYRALGVPDIVKDKRGAAGAALVDLAGVEDPNVVPGRMIYRDFYEDALELGAVMTDILSAKVKSGKADSLFVPRRNQCTPDDMAQSVMNEAVYAANAQGDHVMEMSEALIAAVIAYVKKHPFEVPSVAAGQESSLPIEE